MTTVQFPAMRASVIDALTALADRGYQESVWGRVTEGGRCYDDLTMNVHVLSDDCRVLPDPSGEVGTVLFPEDVAPLERLGVVLDALINDLGDSPDADYLADPRWYDVVAAAGRARERMSSRE